MLKKAMQKSVIMTMLVFGLLLTTAAPAAMAQGRNCRTRNYNTSSYYDNSSYYNDRYYRDNYRRDRAYRDSNYYDDYYYRDRRDTTGRTLRDVGIGAAVGAGGGAL